MPADLFALFTSLFSDGALSLPPAAIVAYMLYRSGTETFFIFLGALFAAMIVPLVLLLVTGEAFDAYLNSPWGRTAMAAGAFWGLAAAQIAYARRLMVGPTAPREVDDASEPPIPESTDALETSRLSASERQWARRTLIGGCLLVVFAVGATVLSAFILVNAAFDGRGTMSVPMPAGPGFGIFVLVALVSMFLFWLLLVPLLIAAAWILRKLAYAAIRLLDGGAPEPSANFVAGEDPFDPAAPSVARRLPFVARIGTKIRIVFRYLFETVRDYRFTGFDSARAALRRASAVQQAAIFILVYFAGYMAVGLLVQR